MTHHDDSDDSGDLYSLLERALNNDFDAGEEFCKRMEPIFMRVFLRFEDRDLERARDSCQEFFRHLFENDSERLRTFDPKRGVPLDAFLICIATRFAIGRLRGREAKDRKRWLPIESVQDLPTDLDSADVRLILRELAEHAKHLPPEERRVLFYLLLGYRPREIAKLLGISVETVYRIIRRLREDLRDVFGDE